MGLLLASRYWWRLVAGWLLVALPFYLLAWFIPNTFLALLLLWWFKPLYERIPTITIATSIFGGQADRKTMRRNILSMDTLRWLTILRLAPGRSTLVPVACLEGENLGMARIGRRRQLIKNEVFGAYCGLIALFFAIELALVATLILSSFFFFSPANPDMYPDGWVSLIEFLSWLTTSYWGPKFLLTGFFISFALVAPFFVCSGFSLYINRRIKLEGWDIDVGFRRLVQRVGVLAVLAVLASPFEPAVAQSSEAESAEVTRQQMQQEIVEISYSDEVSRLRTVRAPEDSDLANFALPPLIRWILQISAWILLVALVVWIAFKARTWAYDIRSRRAKSDDAAIAHHLPLKRTLDLPQDIIGSARQAWNAGEYREALSLLYRGSLFTLITRHQCDIDPADTESSCMRAVTTKVPELRDSFRTITLQWQRLAYAGLPVDDSDFNQLTETYAQDFL